MNPRRRPLGAWLAWLGSSLAAAQELPPLPPRLELPFSTMPTQIPGPPRAEGELPPYLSEPPSGLPGRMFGPPRAEGYSPTSPNPFTIPAPTAEGRFPSLPPFLPQPGPSGLGPLPFPPTDGQPLAPPSELPGGGLAAPARGLPEYKLEDSPFLPRTPSSRVPGPTKPLLLPELLATTERTFPPFQAYLQQREVASGELLAALGSFDLNLSTDSRNWGLGYYKRYLYDVFFEQPLQSWGAKLFAGYRLGAGDWPIYYQYLQTNGGGAYVAGMDVSLLRDGWIDAKRAKLYQAELERRKVEPAISKQRISLLKDAAKSYWSWVGAGLGYGVYEKLLTVAEVRNRALERQVREGAVAPVELVDNQRVVLSRQSTLIAARRRFQQATIDLSLYLRDGYGLPTLAEPERLPEDFPPIEPPDPNRLPEDFEVAVRLRPELRSLQLDGLKIDIDRQLAENQRLPGLNLYLYSEQNVGAPVPLRNKGPFLLESSLLMEVPLQRRFARGRVVAANAALRQNRYAEQYARDRIIADVQDGFSALQTSYEQWLRLNEAVRLNRELEQAEIRRFATGASNILFVNIREQATADAQIYAIEAATKYFFSLADYRAALGVDALPPGTISP